MILNQEVSDVIWQEIRVNYEAGKYSDAVHDSIRVFRDLLREKTGSHNDGVALANYALGGKQPKLKLNPYITTSQIDEQKGYRSLLQGVFQGIRNPREHDHIDDDQKTADTLIVFIDHLVSKIQATEPTFSVDHIVNLITEEYFNPDEKYLGTLLSKIPKPKYQDVLFKLFDFRHCNQVNLDSLSFAVFFIFKTLDTENQQHYLDFVSEALRNENIAQLSSTLQFVPDGSWEKIERLAKGRIEQILYKVVSTDFQSIYRDFVEEVSDTYENYCDFKNQVIRFLPAMDRKKEIVNTIASRVLFDDSFPDWLKFFITSGVLEHLIGNLCSYKDIMRESIDQMFENVSISEKPYKYDELFKEVTNLDSSIIELMPYVKSLIEDDFIDF